MDDDAHPLLGRWRLLDESDTSIVIECVFHPDGRLLHTVQAGGGSILTELVYRIDGATIVSSLVGETDENRTAFEFSDGRRLRLDGPESMTWWEWRGACDTPRP